MSAWLQKFKMTYTSFVGRCPHCTEAKCIGIFTCFIRLCSIAGSAFASVDSSSTGQCHILALRKALHCKVKLCLINKFQAVGIIERHLWELGLLNENIDTGIYKPEGIDTQRYRTLLRFEESSVSGSPMAAVRFGPDVDLVIWWYICGKSESQSRSTYTD